MLRIEGSGTGRVRPLFVVGGEGSTAAGCLSLRYSTPPPILALSYLISIAYSIDAAVEY